eukprot:856607-Alexandrium_andersonii.AAC.1
MPREEASARRGARAGALPTRGRRGVTRRALVEATFGADRELGRKVSVGVSSLLARCGTVEHR